MAVESWKMKILGRLVFKMPGTPREPIHKIEEVKKKIEKARCGKEKEKHAILPLYFLWSWFGPAQEESQTEESTAPNLF